MSKTRKQKATLTPRPARKTETAEPEADNWLESITPKGAFHKGLATVWLQDITKSDAAEWLLRVPEYQRSKKARSLKEFLADMLEGLWIPDDALVAFDRKGDLINGQHVLTSLMQSALPSVSCVVLINRHPDAYLGFDLVQRRSLADNLKGETSAPGAVGKVLHVLEKWDRGDYAGKSYVNSREGSVALGGRRGRERLKQNPGIERHLFPNPFRTNQGYRSVAAMHAASYRLHAIDPQKAEEFFRKFTEGTGLQAADPIYALRKKFMNMGEHDRLRSGPTLALIIAAWNAWLLGGTGLAFRVGQPFPPIGGPLEVPESPRSSSKVH